MEVPYRADNLTAMPLEHYLGRLKEADPMEISGRLQLPYEDGKFHMKVLGEEKTVSFPAFDDDGWTDRWRILFARYLLEGKKAGAYSAFSNYRELPWGDVYNEKFRQRCILRLAGTYGARADVYASVCEKLGALLVKGSGKGYEFCFLPGLYVRFILWEGDDEFPASSQILFSDNFPNAFAAEDRVVVCEYILGRMKEALQ